MKIPNKKEKPVQREPFLHLNHSVHWQIIQSESIIQSNKTTKFKLQSI